MKKFINWVKKVFLEPWYILAAVLLLGGFFCAVSIGSCYGGNCHLNQYFIPGAIIGLIGGGLCLKKAWNNSN